MIADDSHLVSVIVPIYNAELYLERCLDSIVNQTYPNIEIVLINDGSMDNSEAICRRYEEKDARVRLFCQKNQGISSARNSGLDRIRGEYLTFVDADDYLSPCFIEILLGALLREKVLMAVCSYDTPCENETPKMVSYSNQTYPMQKMSRDTVYDELTGVNQVLFAAPWGKLYCRKLFQRLRYPVDKLHEDEFICCKIYQQVEEIVLIDLHMYHYVQTVNSIMRKDGAGRITSSDAIEAYLNQLVYFQSYGNTRYVHRIISRLIGAAIDRYPNLDITDREALQKIDAVRADIYRITRKRPFMAKYLLYRISPRLYRSMKAIYRKLKNLKKLKQV